MTLEDIDIFYIEPFEGCLHSGEDMLQTPSLGPFFGHQLNICSTYLSAQSVLVRIARFIEIRESRRCGTATVGDGHV